MGPLTDSVEATLVAAARLRAEPESFFDAYDLVEYMNDNPFLGGEERYARTLPRELSGMGLHSLKALERRGLVEMHSAGWCLTKEGFEEAMRITGGRGLL